MVYTTEYMYMAISYTNAKYSYMAFKHHISFIKNKLY